MQTTELKPFGLLVETSGDPEQLDTQQLEDWLATHKVIVIRGLDTLSRRRLPLLARRFGPIQSWSFGAINELKVDPQANNYLFTNAPVPLHWDGAFKGEIPRTLFFHCVEASPESGGETIFVDAQAAWQKASPEQQQRWASLRFRYQTEALAHYGGQFEAPLLQQHPVTKTPTLRFAEPVHDLNPVTVEALDCTPEQSQGHIQALQEHLQNPNLRLVHRWQSGDLLIADNDALLHGRNAFTKDQPRHLRRVNLLTRQRPALQWLKDSIRIRRPEFMVAEIPILLIPALLLTEAAKLQSWTMLEGSLLFFLLFHFGDMINCYADRELDAVYETPLSEAVYGLGLRNVRGQMIATVLLALALALHLDLSLARGWLTPLVALGLLLGSQYSVGLRLKARGLWQIPTLWAIIFVGPMLLVAGLLTPTPPPLLGLIAALYGALQVGVVLVNTAEDYQEDLENGLRTSAVALGPTRCLTLAATLVGLSGAALVALAVVAALQLGALKAWAGVAVFSVGWLWALIRIGSLARGLSSLPEQDQLAQIRKAGQLIPVWITIVAWSSLSVVAALGPVLGAKP